MGTPELLRVETEGMEADRRYREAQKRLLGLGKTTFNPPLPANAKYHRNDHVAVAKHNATENKVRRR